MPSPRRKAHQRRLEYTHEDYFHLAFGYDWFGSQWGRENNEATLDDMRSAWKDVDVRAAVYELLENRRRHGNGSRRIPWAAEQFGEDGNDFFEDGEDADDPGDAVSNEPAAPVLLSCTQGPTATACGADGSTSPTAREVRMD